MSASATIAPVVVSQDTCLAAYGVSSSWYLERAGSGAFPSWRIGELVLSRPEDFLRYLRSLPPSGSERSATTFTKELAAATVGLGRIGT